MRNKQCTSDALKGCGRVFFFWEFRNSQWSLRNIALILPRFLTHCNPGFNAMMVIIIPSLESKTIPIFVTVDTELCTLLASCNPFNCSFKASEVFIFGWFMSQFNFLSLCFFFFFSKTSQLHYCQADVNEKAQLRCNQCGNSFTNGAHVLCWECEHSETCKKMIVGWFKGDPSRGGSEQHFSYRFLQSAFTERVLHRSRYSISPKVCSALKLGFVECPRILLLYILYIQD